MINVIHSIEKWTVRILDVFSGLLLIAMTAFVLIQIVARYFLVVATPWTEEGARILMVWMCFVGSASMMIRGEHLTIDVFFHKFSPKGQKVLQLLFDIVTLCFAVILFYYSIKLITNPMIRRGTTTVTHLPYGWYYGCLPLAMTLIAVYELMDIIERVYDFIRGTDTRERLDIDGEKGAGV